MSQLQTAFLDSLDEIRRLITEHHQTKNQQIQNLMQTTSTTAIEALVVWQNHLNALTTRLGQVSNQMVQMKCRTDSFQNHKHTIFDRQGS